MAKQVVTVNQRIAYHDGIARAVGHNVQCVNAFTLNSRTDLPQNFVIIGQCNGRH